MRRLSDYPTLMNFQFNHSSSKSRLILVTKEEQVMASDTKKFDPIDEDIEFRVYKKRWFMVMIYWFCAPAITMQYQLYSVIANLLVNYYGISFTLAESTATVNLIVSLIFMVPFTYISHVIGLRWSIIVGVSGSCLGAWLKVLSVEPSRYWLLLLAQGIVAAFNVFFTPQRAKLPAVWFSKHEISKACSLCIMASLSGNIIGAIIPSFIVPDATPDKIGEGLTRLAYFVAIYNSIALPLVVLFFADAPPTPPSLAQLTATQQKSKKAIDYLRSLKRIFTNRSFVFLLIVYGLIFSMMGPLVINLNQVITTTYPDSTKDVGYISVAIAVSLPFGSFCSGILSDRYRRFKLLFNISCILLVVVTVLFVETMTMNLYIVYVFGVLTGFVSEILNAVCYELALEFNFPEPENVISAILVAIDQLSGFIFSTLRSYMLGSVGDVWANSTLYIAMCVGLVSIFGMKFTLRRQNAESRLATVS